MTEAKVFEGIKVVDFSWVVAGPLAVKYLADYGATVVKIESMEHPDVLRLSAPYKDNKPGVNRSGYFAYYEHNKLSLSLNLNHPSAKEVVLRLVSWGDIVVENFAPGAMEKWGLDYGELKKVKPEIIMLSISNQGQTGPWSRVPSYGTLLTAMAGFSDIIGWPDHDPLMLNLAWPDFIAAPAAFTALIAALEYRQNTGKGQHLDLSQLEISLLFQSPLVLDYVVNGRENKRNGNSSPFAAPHGVFKCRGEDKWCAIAVFTDEEWNALCRAMGNLPWTKEVRFSTLLLRKRNEEELNHLVETWTINFNPEELVSQLQTSGVSAGVVKSAADLYDDPQIRNRNALWSMMHEEIGQCTCLGQPSILSRTSAELQRSAPLLGQDTLYVCQELLGISEEEFDQMVINGVFGEGY
ncbi:MAG: CoA transferase [Chloroflexota bacterium]|nr:CoA transferase [Chloroflexota bacterium]